MNGTRRTKGKRLAAELPAVAPVAAAALLSRPLVIAAAAALAALFLALSLTPLTNNDIWLHMANGKWILEHGRVPLTDPYSFSAGGNRFYAHEWLAGVLFDLVHRASGVSGLIWIKTVLGAAALLFCVWTARREGGAPLPTLTCAWLALAIVNSRFLERPEMFSYALTGVYLAVFSMEHRRLADEPARCPLGRLGRPDRLLGSSLLWWLVPLQWAWVQIHGYFLTGLALLVLFLAAEQVERIRRLGAGLPYPAASCRLISGAAAVLTMVLLGLLNPNGLEIYTFPFELAGGKNIFMQTIFEWRPTFTTSAMFTSSMFLAFCLWLGLLAAACLDSRRLLQRHWLWRCVCVAGAAVLLAQRLPLGKLPPSSTMALPGSAWLWSPVELLAATTGRPALRDALGPGLAPFRLVGAWGDDIFTLLWVGLMIWTVRCWRKPASAGLPVLAVTLMFVFQHARLWAPVPFDALGLAPAGGGRAMHTMPLGPGWLVEKLTPEGVVVLLLVLPALLYAGWRRSMPAWHLVLTGAFLVLAIKQNRNIVNFALVTLPVLAPALTRTAQALGGVTVDESRLQQLPALPPRLTARTQAIAFLIVCWGMVLVTVTSGWPYTPNVAKKVGFGVGPRIPVGAVEYARVNGIQGRVFNKYAYGAYLIHELYPGTRVFMDSRNDVYGPKLYETYLSALHKAAVAERVFAIHDFDYVLVDYAFYPRPTEDAGLFAFLRRHEEWVLVYFDDTSVLYLRDDEENANLIARDGYRVLDPEAYRPGAGRELSRDDLAVYDRESERALRRQPASIVARMLRVDCLVALRRYTEALEVLEEVIRDDPHNLFALVSGARLARDLGDPERARALYRRARQLHPGIETLRLEMQELPEERSG
jgi:hypothetical protein